ncbi:YbdD/YjiX family protein [Agrococcus terreus]|uniref:YbdD/YjiX family protein n=1 Tax=Agrococcus terreus TaxID=574649 RepID=A0ABQ2KMG7_9MICO|nr:YbdD/YjiX family protein [Agrococcus terreus]GGN87380.1 hypothetical protein GCM10010968_21870 [Agrococcus terreus]
MATRGERRPAAAGALLARAWRAVVWYGKGLTGESRYDAYVVHARAAHPDREPMGRDAYWRDYAKWQDANPQGRCC